MRFENIDILGLGSEDAISQEYKRYIKEHRDNVHKAYVWLKENVLKVIEPNCTKTGYDIEDIIREHDVSKYHSINNIWEPNGNEFYPYRDYFYGDKKDDGVEDKFDLAWLHHQHSNPHHWQYWVLLKDSGSVVAKDMPYEYIVEMICDWWSFSWKSGNLKEIFEWYDNNKNNMILSDTTRRTVEEILSKMKEVLLND